MQFGPCEIVVSKSIDLFYSPLGCVVVCSVYCHSPLGSVVVCSVYCQIGCVDNTHVSLSVNIINILVAKVTFTTGEGTFYVSPLFILKLLNNQTFHISRWQRS